MDYHLKDKLALVSGSTRVSATLSQPDSPARVRT